MVKLKDPIRSAPRRWRKHVRTLACAVPAVALAFSMSAPASALADETQDAYHGVPIELLSGPAVDVIPNSSTGGIPSYYMTKYTCPKNQRQLGSCWAFATVSALESSAINEGIASNPDYSELALGYYSYSSSDGLFDGGNPQIAADLLMRWVGPVNEYGQFGGLPFPYPSSDNKEEDRSTITGYITQITGYITQNMFDRYYATMADSLHVDGYRLVNSSDVPTMKKSIMEYGAGAISMLWNPDNIHESLGSDDGTTYNYTGSSMDGHSLAVVGWDDNYSRNNFQEYCRPSSDGAWYVKNSWGDQSSFLWIPYECPGFWETNVVFFDVSGISEHGENDLLGSGSLKLPLSSTGYESQAGIFRASHGGYLDSVSVYTDEVDSSIDLTVHTNLADMDDPTSGTVAYRLSTTQRYPGYNRIDLGDAVQLMDGEPYSVVATIKDCNGQSCTYYEANLSNYNHYLGPINYGESMVKNGDAWEATGRDRSIAMIAHVDTSVPTASYAGDTRYGTAAKGVAAAYPNGSDGVIIASRTSFPDAISASGLAGVLGYPILLTDPSYLPSETSAEIDALRSGSDGFRIVVVGGESAVSGDVYWLLGHTYGWGGISRISGQTRYDTCAALYSAAPSSSWGTTAIVCNGENYPDALSASPYAYAAKAPVFLASSDGGLTEGEVSAINGNPGIESVVIVGGTSVVPQWVDSLFPDKSVERIPGDNRYSTAVKVSDMAAREGVLSWSDCGFVSGDNFPDALAAGPAQGSRRGILLQVTGTDYSYDRHVIEALPSRGVGSLRWYGGPAAIPDALRAYVLDAADGRY